MSCRFQIATVIRWVADKVEGRRSVKITARRTPFNGGFLTNGWLRISNGWSWKWRTAGLWAQQGPGADVLWYCIDHIGRETCNGNVNDDIRRELREIWCDHEGWEVARWNSIMVEVIELDGKPVILDANSEIPLDWPDAVRNLVSSMLKR